MSHPTGDRFKDAEGRIKRQAARFRIYAYARNGVALRELTAAEATIEWTVQLANKKASYDMFLGKYWAIQYVPSNLHGVHPKRYEEVTDAAQRAALLDIKPEDTVGQRYQPAQPADDRHVRPAAVHGGRRCRHRDPPAR